MNRKTNEWIIAGTSAIILVLLAFFYVFILLGEIVSALVAFLIACAISLGLILRDRSRRSKETVEEFKNEKDNA